MHEKCPTAKARRLRFDEAEDQLCCDRGIDGTPPGPQYSTPSFGGVGVGANNHVAPGANKRLGCSRRPACRFWLFFGRLRRCLVLADLRQSQRYQNQDEQQVPSRFDRVDLEAANCERRSARLGLHRAPDLTASAPCQRVAIVTTFRLPQPQFGPHRHHACKQHLQAAIHNNSGIGDQEGLVRDAPRSYWL